VFAVGLPDIVDVHLHPSDIGGAIVALDRPEAPGAWRWGGPAWQEAVPAHEPRGATAATLQTADAVGMAARWAQVLGAPLAEDGRTVRLERDGAVRFTDPTDERGDGIVAFDLAVTPDIAARGTSVEIGGVRFALRAA
jgi:hypothetical protein